MAGLNQENNLFPRCLICGVTPETGIIGGVQLRKRFLCSECQERILNASIEDPFYILMKEGLKELWWPPVSESTSVSRLVISDRKRNKL